MHILDINEKVKRFVNANIFEPTLEVTSDHLHYYIYFKTYRLELHVIQFESGKECRISFEGYEAKESERIKYVIIHNYNYGRKEDDLEHLTQDINKFYNKFSNLLISFN